MEIDSTEPAPSQRTRSIRFLGREPSTWIATVGAVLVALAALGVPFLTAGQASATAALLVALILVATTRPVAPGLATGVVTAGVALMASYGLALSDEAVAAATGATLAIFALVARNQVEPKDTWISRR